MTNLLSKALTGLAAASLVLAAPLTYAANSATYTGQGLNSNPDGFGGYDLNLEICGVANGADADGPYLLWVFTSTGATSGTITGPWGTAAMTKMGGGTLKFVSGWYPPATLPGHVSATSNGKTKNAQLVVSHGCRPYTHGAWCSPGFWGHAQDGAWAKTGYTGASLFNSTVSPGFYGATFTADPSLSTVLLTTGGTYKGAGVAGTLGYSAMNAFNATGAFLSNNIPGYTFSEADMLNDSDTCPLDNFGNWKTQ